MNFFTIRTRTIFNFGVVLSVVLAVGLFAHWRLTTILEQAHVLKSDSIEGLHQSALIKDALTTNFLALFELRDPAKRAEAEQRLARSQADIERLKAEYEQSLIVDDDREAFERVVAAFAGYERARASMLGQARGQIVAAPSETSEREQMSRFDAAFDAIADLAAANRTSAVAETDAVVKEITSLLSAMKLSFALALAVAAVAGFLLLRAITVPLKQLTRLMDTVRQGDFTQRMTIVRKDELGEVGDGFNRMADQVMELVGHVQRAGIRVSTSMTEIAATSKQQQATASEVAATTTEIGATSREIAATSRELVRTMSEVTTVSEHTAELASGGQAELTNMEEAMSQVMEAAASINAKLAVLNDKAGDINQVVTTITKIADQTNLLSLNAAIEAEKAGEYGRGFAVVSSEIRRLADQTAVATYDIEQMVKEIQSAVSASVMGMDKFSEQVRRGLHDVQEIGGKLSEIIVQVQTLAPRFETVSESMQAQSTGAEQISEALVQLTEATQQTVESLRQSSDAIEELNRVSGNLNGSIARFKLSAV
jgi:methyl-accepting chemotaxis protein WspA